MEEDRMGWTSVAILHHDHVHQMEGTPLGDRMADAIRLWDAGRGNFGAGAVISQAHADVAQVVIVQGNTGSELEDAGPNRAAIWQMISYLERNGYKVTKRRKPKGSAGDPDTAKQV